MKKLFTVSVLALLLVSMFAGLGVWQIKLAPASHSHEFMMANKEKKEMKK